MTGRFLAALLLVVQLCACQQAEAVSGQVTRVYDGDTIEVENIGRVRLLGIDTPETEASERDLFYQHQLNIRPAVLRRIARQATDFVSRHSHHQIVTLTFDRERTDAYGRTLAYVYLPDGLMLNRMLVAHGLAAVYRRAEFKHKNQFMVEEAQARERGRGMWR